MLARLLARRAAPQGAGARAFAATAAAASPAARAGAAAPPSAAGTAAQPTFSSLLPPLPPNWAPRRRRARPVDADISETPFVAPPGVRPTTHMAPPGVRFTGERGDGAAAAARAVSSAGGRAATGAPPPGDFDPTSASSSHSSASGSSSDGGGSTSGGEEEAAAAAAGGARAPAGAPTPVAAGAAVAAPEPPRRFAVVALGGTQYKVTAGDVINAEHVRGAGVGDELTLRSVLAVGSPTRTVLGRPTVPGAAVRVSVEEVVLDRKVIVFKKKRRKRYQRLRGHRRRVTRLRVLSVDGGGEW